MRVEKVHQAEGAAQREHWLVGWHRVVEDDGSTVAYCPDVVTANMIIQAEKTRHYLIDRCRTTCPAVSLGYAGQVSHEPNCPAYGLNLVPGAEAEGVRG